MGRAAAQVFLGNADHETEIGRGEPLRRSPPPGVDLLPEPPETEVPACDEGNEVLKIRAVLPSVVEVGDGLHRQEVGDAGQRGDAGQDLGLGDIQLLGEGLFHLVPQRGVECRSDLRV